MEETMDGVKRRAIGANNSGQFMTREQRYLLAKLAQLDAETVKDIRNGNLQFADADYYIRAIIAGGTTTLLDQNNKKLEGTSNFDENHLAPKTYLAVGNLRLAYGFSAAAGGSLKPEDQVYSNTGAVPAPILNGEFVIKLNDKPIVEFPVARFFNSSATAASHTIQGYGDIVVLGSMKLIAPNDQITIEIKTARGVAMPAGNHFIEARLLGASTKRR